MKELKRGTVEHNYHHCTWGYMLCICTKFNLKPSRRDDSSIPHYVSLELEKEGIEITWFCNYDDREKWENCWNDLDS